MTRDDFLAEVRALADDLAAKLWDAIMSEIDAAKAVALEAVKGQFRAQIAGDAPDQVAAAVTDQPVRRRAPRRCSGCDQLGHDIRHCPKVSGNGAAAAPTAAVPGGDPEQPAAPDTEPERDEALAEQPTDDEDQDEEPVEDDDEDPRAAPSLPSTRTDRFARIEAAAARRATETRRA